MTPNKIKSDEDLDLPNMAIAESSNDTRFTGDEDLPSFSSSNPFAELEAPSTQIEDRWVSIYSSQIWTFSS